VNHFDYRQSRFERLAGIAPSAFVTAQLRIPTAVLGSALLLLTAGWTLEIQRVHTLEHDLNALLARTRGSASAAERANLLIADVAHLRADDARIVSARRAALLSTNAIARLGNALPPQTWLTNVESTPAGAWTIAGRSAEIAEIGTTLRTIQQFDARAATRLVSISASGRSGEVLDFIIDWQPGQ
jgi:hypothetical protein